MLLPSMLNKGVRPKVGRPNEEEWEVGRHHRSLLLSTLGGVAGRHYILGSNPGRLAEGDGVPAAAYLRHRYHRNW